MDDQKCEELRTRWGQEPSTGPSDRPALSGTVSLFLTLSVVAGAILVYLAVTEPAIQAGVWATLAVAALLVGVIAVLVAILIQLLKLNRGGDWSLPTRSANFFYLRLDFHQLVGYALAVVPNVPPLHYLEASQFFSLLDLVRCERALPARLDLFVIRRLD